MLPGNGTLIVAASVAVVGVAYVNNILNAAYRGRAAATTTTTSGVDLVWAPVTEFAFNVSGILLLPIWGPYWIAYNVSKTISAATATKARGMTSDGVGR